MTAGRDDVCARRGDSMRGRPEEPVQRNEIRMVVRGVAAQSERSATIGSTRAARSAGTQQPSSAVATSSSATAA